MAERKSPELYPVEGAERTAEAEVAVQKLRDAAKGGDSKAQEALQEINEAPNVKVYSQ
jgi:hypothetical protein